MTDVPNPKTIDFAKVFSGQEYPKDSVHVVTDRKLAYSVHKLREALQEANRKGDADEITGLEATYEEVLKAAEGHSFTFHLTDVSRETKRAVLDSVNKDFDIETDMFGQMKANPAAEEAYKARMWAVHTERIVGPDGAEIVSPTEENLLAFLAGAPDKAIQDIDAKISEFGSGTSEGLDSIIRDADFLS